MLVGKYLGRYKIVGLLGKGGMARVYKAYDPRFEREVAIKVLSADFASDPEFRRRFEGEMKKLARLDHPNIAQIYDSGEQDEYFYMVLQYLPKGDLRSLLGRPLAVGRALRIMREVAAALAAAHQQSIIHRDLKPANILIAEDGRAVLSDFGIAKIMNASMATQKLTQTGVGMGTPHYMAPEQVLGRPIDARCDVYSFGVLAFELLIGRPPFEGDTPSIVATKHVQEPFPRPRLMKPDLPSALEGIILRCVSREPAGRFPNGSALLARIEQLPQELAESSTSEETVPIGEEEHGGPIGNPASGRRFNRMQIALIASASLLVLAGLAFGVARVFRGSGDGANNPGGDRAVALIDSSGRAPGSTEFHSAQNAPAEGEEDSLPGSSSPTPESGHGGPGKQSDDVEIGDRTGREHPPFPPNPPAPRLAALIVTTVPSGARVSVTQDEVTRTRTAPAAFDSLVASTCQVHVEKAGYLRADTVVTLRAASRAFVQFSLRSPGENPGTIEVSTNTRASLFLDGELVRSGVVAARIEAASGSHVLRLEAPGFEPKEWVGLRVAGDSTIELSHSFPLEQTGSLHVISGGAWAEVRLDGRATGMTTPCALERISPGWHTVALGRGDSTLVGPDSILVFAGRTAEIDFTGRVRRNAR